MTPSVDKCMGFRRYRRVDTIVEDCDISRLGFTIDCLLSLCHLELAPRGRRTQHREQIEAWFLSLEHGLYTMINCQNT
jgi:hypothetical protein